MQPDATSPDELEAIEWLGRYLGEPPPGEVWVGDDAAVLEVTGTAPLLIASDAIVDGVHFDRRYSSLADVGWKALAVNLSDIAAMGARPRAAVVTVSGAGSTELRELYQGLREASRAYGCPIVGGDITEANQLVVSVAITGHPEIGNPVLRSGARPDDLIYVTGALGNSAAGLCALQADPGATGEHVDAHRRPTPRLAAGAAIARAGATAMIDISDGFCLDLYRVLEASHVGAAIDAVPVATAATRDQAFGGGEDFELIFCATQSTGILAAFEQAGLDQPFIVGRIVADPTIRLIEGAPLEPLGYEHRLGNR